MCGAEEGIGKEAVVAYLWCCGTEILRISGVLSRVVTGARNVVV
jgi:hypothetical protein